VSLSLGSKVFCRGGFLAVSFFQNSALQACRALDAGLSVYDRIYKFVANNHPAALLSRFNFVRFPIALEKMIVDYQLANMTQQYNGVLTYDPQEHKALISSVLTKIKPQVKKTKEFGCEVRLVASEVKKAVALSLGKVIVTEGLIKNVRFAKILESKSSFDSKVNYADLKEEDKIAAVLAHAMAHSESRNILKKNEFLWISATALTFVKLGFIGFKNGQSLGVQSVCKIAKPVFMKWVMAAQMGKIYDRIMFGENELQADRRCIELLDSSGYNPKSALWMMEFYAKSFPLPVDKIARIVRLRYDLMNCPSRKERFEIMKKQCESVKGYTEAT